MILILIVERLLDSKFEFLKVELIEIRVKALEGVHSDYGDRHEDPNLVIKKPPVPPLAGPTPSAIPSMSLQGIVYVPFFDLTCFHAIFIGTEGRYINVASESSILSGKVTSPMNETVKMKNSLEPASPAVANSEKIRIAVTLGNSVAQPNVKKDAAITEIGGATPSDEKIVELGPLVYESKAEAKSAFKNLLESANISQKKKLESEERRVKQKNAQEDFRIMLEDRKELLPSSRWSKAVSTIEHDEHFKAVEQAKDPEDFSENYVEKLENKEHAKALEEQKRNRVKYLEFLKSCDFIKASSQWRKVQDRLETDERCSLLEKIDRLEIFQEYIRDLESEEEEQRKLRMIKDFAAYPAVSSNTSGSTAKNLFTDVMDELEKQVK
ncbi:hypothetical protein T459_28980 [Capsicum annuum]|uniref:FF domain-containing protein n=1 Tax=Capsicum annuum TaxID=4072 RepID=A0A2G2YIB0_CAPAN|nr:hypothetical protein T459_28980 [Capsicum annuum]